MLIRPLQITVLSIWNSEYAIWFHLESPQCLHPNCIFAGTYDWFGCFPWYFNRILNQILTNSLQRLNFRLENFWWKNSDYYVLSACDTFTRKCMCYHSREISTFLLITSNECLYYKSLCYTNTCIQFFNVNKRSLKINKRHGESYMILNRILLMSCYCN